MRVYVVKNLLRPREIDGHIPSVDLEGPDESVKGST